MDPESRRFTVDKSAPTSRAAFRALAKSIGTTNRQADTLRSSLLTDWAASEGIDELECRLRDLEPSRPDGSHAVEALLAVWFSFAEPLEGKMVRGDASVLDGMPDAVRETLAAIHRAD